MRNAIRPNRRFQLQERVETPDGAGGVSVTWAALGWLWGELRFGHGRVQEDGGLDVAKGRFRIVVHAAPYGAASRPVAGQVLVEGTRRFLLQSVGEFGADGKYLICHALEEVSP